MKTTDLRRATLTVLTISLSCSMPVYGQRPAPADADVSYGSSPHQLLDIYVPPGKGPFPVLVWFGGIWKASKGAPDPKRFLSANIAEVAIEVRTMNDAVEDKVNPPISYVMEDACRAVQFLRLNASRWHLDPERIAAGGSSQGALPALYLGCSADRADPKSTDPIARMSTRVLCVAAHRSQPSIDPKRMQGWVPGVKWGAPALGCSFEQSLQKRDQLSPVIDKWSPDALLHKGAAPIYFENNWGLTRPEKVGEMDYLVHSPAWALGFQKLAREAGVPCYVKFPDHPTEGYADIWDFLIKQLHGKTP